MVTDDPLLVRWGLHDLLEGYSDYSSSGVGRTSVQTNDHACTEFVQPGESYTVRGFSSADDDEVIAQALQEELSGEGSERAQDWWEWAGPFADIWSAEGATQNDYDPTSNCNYDSGPDSEDEGVPQISDDFATYDGEVRKRLTHMDSVPHVPRINGEIPTIDDAAAAHQRLLDRLKLYGLSELKVDGDGNCQFRAFSDQLYRTPANHKSVRDDVVTQLASHPEYYEGYVPMKYSDYVKAMARSGEWGDHVTLQAAADFYGVRICLLTSFKDTSFVQILPRQTKSKRVIFLSFWAEVHYNSVYAEGDVTLYPGHKKKGKCWRHYFKDKLRL
ncbi:hypothetical protein GOP47_0021992 [Adiantum capillus-veneris]|uniref:ubiquitinyl hydrolase 1 n=1 Tax=Adiantum capillus-veneris TaxID=13818 RepID=A0A9D4Z734_ADICA|nr:hypothetical protein GOP47_0021992 [Adiantum capillus-veneris]